MQHCDEETLSLLALGEPGPTRVIAHIADCARCGRELTTLRQVVSAARSGGATDSVGVAVDSGSDEYRPQAGGAHGSHSSPGSHTSPGSQSVHGAQGLQDGAGLHGAAGLRGAGLHDGAGLHGGAGGGGTTADVARLVPPDGVWAAIAAATGVQAVPRADEVARHAGHARTAVAVAEEFAPPLLVGSGRDARSGPADRSGPGVPAGPRVLRRDRRPAARRRSLGRLSAIAASLVVGLVVGGVAGPRLVDRGEDPPSVLAATDLTALAAAPGASGRADVVRSADGRILDLDVRRLARADGFYEVWLIDPTVTKMVPVGILNGSTGRFTLPPDMDLAAYPVVDISIEPMDGDPAHSGQSVLRGTLRS